MLNQNGFDLNLFPVLAAIHRTGSVTLAGEHLGLTQSAVSNALKRSRERFKDPLFVRTRRGMEATPMAQRLIGPVNEGLAQLEWAVDQGETFEPATSDRIFRLAMNDIGHVVFMPRLFEEARRVAPFVRFETVSWPASETRSCLMDGRIDVAVGSWSSFGDAFNVQTIFSENFVVMMRADSEAAARLEFGREEYLEAEHLAYRPCGATDDALQTALKGCGMHDQRKVVLTAANSLGLSTMVANSDLLLTVPERLALAMQAVDSTLHIRPAPFLVSPLVIRQQWHERFQYDEGNRWLRQTIFRLFHQRAINSAYPAEAAAA